MASPQSTTRYIFYMRIIIVAIWIQFAVWSNKLPRILDMIESRPRRNRDDRAVVLMLSLIENISNFKYFVIRRNCLKKNLLFYYFLVTSNITGINLHIGVRKPGQQIDGHCWLTRDEQVYLDTELNISKYTVMYKRGV